MPNIGIMDQRKLKNTPGARKAKVPSFIPPQLATLVKEPPSGDEWLHKLTFDGYRMLCRVDRGRVSVWSRRWLRSLPSLKWPSDGPIRYPSFKASVKIRIPRKSLGKWRKVRGPKLNDLVLTSIEESDRMRPHLKLIAELSCGM